VDSVIARWRGDEFAVLFADGSPEYVHERMQKVVETLPEMLRHEATTPSTLSVGVSWREVNVLESHMFMANKALKEAKIQGGNVVVVCRAGVHQHSSEVWRV
jgi:PleD family two-component response regulator